MKSYVVGLLALVFVVSVVMAYRAGTASKEATPPTHDSVEPIPCSAAYTFLKKDLEEETLFGEHQSAEIARLKAENAKLWKALRPRGLPLEATTFPPETAPNFVTPNSAEAVALPLCDAANVGKLFTHQWGDGTVTVKRCSAVLKSDTDTPGDLYSWRPVLCTQGHPCEVP